MSTIYKVALFREFCIPNTNETGSRKVSQTLALLMGYPMIETPVFSEASAYCVNMNRAVKQLNRDLKLSLKNKDGLQFVFAMRIEVLK